MSNPRPPRGQQRDKPFREALRMELADAGEELRKLRPIARRLIANATGGDTRAIQEIADRLDGKATQHIEAELNVNYAISDQPLNEAEWIAAHVAPRAETAH